MANGKRGRRITRAHYDKLWERFDALPASVKAACWDAMQPWHSGEIAQLADRLGPGGAILVIQNWDEDVCRERKPWLDPRRRQIGMSRAEMPRSPHQQAGATILRSHTNRYERLINARKRRSA